MGENESIFRKKSLDRVNSPEELDHYLKVTNPSFWIFLVAVISLLIGVIVWSTIGKIEAYVDTGCVIKDGTYECYIDENNYSRITNSAVLKINNEKFTVDTSTMEYMYVEEADTYAVKIGLISSDSVFKLTGTANLSNGYYPGKIITEEISPISFIID